MQARRLYELYLIVLHLVIFDKRDPESFRIFSTNTPSSGEAYMTHFHIMKELL